MWLVKICVFLYVIEETWCLHPILLVPGDGGSQLEAQYLKSPPHYICGRQERSFLLWLNLYFMLPITMDCFVESIKLEYNQTSKKTYNPDFCDVSVHGFGVTGTVSYLSNFKVKQTSYFYYLIDELEKNQGYTADKDIRGAPYDFRKSPSEMEKYINDVIKLIETMYEENSRKSIIVVGHSLGTLYAHIILTRMSQEWKTKYISTFISVSGPYSGAIDAIRTIVSGNDEHIPIINPLKVRTAQSSWPSTYFLLPTKGLWPNKTIIYLNQGNFTTNNIVDVLELSKIPNAVDHFRNTNSIPKNVDPPKTSVYCIYSDNVQTSEILDYRNVNFPDSQPQITYGPGDGSVNLDSLAQCSKWANSQNESVLTYVVPDVAHLNILRDDRFLKYTSDVIRKINLL